MPSSSNVGRHFVFLFCKNNTIPSFKAWGGDASSLSANLLKRRCVLKNEAEAMEG
jgi:hypothetical protein